MVRTRRPGSDDAARGPLERAARTSLAESARTLATIHKRNAGSVAAAAEILIACFENGGTAFFCGNGGSAADAQHLACEFAGRYLIDRPGLPSVALTTNSSALTAIGNDYGYDDVFARQLEGIGCPGDVLVAISTSGKSESVRRAVTTAHALGMTVIGMTGARGGEFAAMCDLALVSPHAVTPHIQEGHIAMGHTFCLLVERALFGDLAERAGPKRGATKQRGATPKRSGTARRTGTARTKPVRERAR
ncbi:MAG: D-sedoheptulose 7-phosphate isomerase [Candidatus Eisenbacteria bacterium]|uniref:Phosphoheptose isomerase n=1 Tax=Eiseniibacteriota bacterium TaxID=2212470 RepID=A0A849SRG5_UNCEI|nr:D-sedoheptulose 7-phosphate isomerase [Candidatus Eisenbacteria bacterium]